MDGLDPATTSRPSFPDPDRPILAQVVDLLAETALGEPAPPLEDLGLELGETVSTLDDRFELLAARLALDPLERVVLALTALSDVSPEVGRVLAPQGAVRTTPRIVARLLGHAGYAEGTVYRALDAQSTLVRTGAVRRLAASDDVPLVDGPIACATAVATFLLAADVDDPTRGGRLRRLNPPALPLGRAAVVQRLRELLALADGPVPFVHGPDADLLLATAGGGGVLLAGAVELADPVLRLDAVIAAILEQRVLAIDGLTALEPREAGQLAGRLVNLPRPFLLGHGPRDVSAVEGISITEVRVPAPSHAERTAAWRDGLGDVDEIEAVAALHRLPVARIADAIADVLASSATSG